MADQQSTDPYAATAVAPQQVDPYAATAMPATAPPAPPPAPATTATTPAPGQPKSVAQRIADVLPSAYQQTDSPYTREHPILSKLFGDPSSPDVRQEKSAVERQQGVDAGDETQAATGVPRAAAQAVTGLGQVFLPGAAEERANPRSFQNQARVAHGQFADSSGAPVAAAGSPMTPQETQQAIRQVTGGAANIVEGGGTLMLVADAPSIATMSGLATGAIKGSPAEIAAARVAIAKIAAFAGGGAAASAGAGAASDKLQLSPETKHLVQAVSFFVPSVFGAALGRAGFEGTLGSDAEGNIGGSLSTPGGGKAGFGVGPGGVGAATNIGGRTVAVGNDAFLDRMGPQAGSPAPSPGQIAADTNVKAAASTINEADALDHAAENMVNPPPPPPQPPMPPGMESSTLTPQVVADVASAIRSAPPEMHAQLALEAHGKLADWMLKTGKFIGPDGKLQIADSPAKAASLAQQVLNDEQDRQVKAAEDQQKQQEQAQAEQQKAADAQQKEAEKAAKQTNENGLTPAEVMQQRAKTIIESSDSPEQASATIMRNLRVTRDTAQQLIGQHQQQQVMGSAPDVGSGAEPTKEESRATVDAQVAGLARGEYPVVMLPEGSNYMPTLPPGMKMMSVTGDAPGAGKYIYDPTKLRAATIKEAAKAGTHGDLLGHIQSKEELSDGKPTVVVQAHTADGTPIQDSQVHADPALVEAQAQALNERHPEAHISVKSPEQVLEERMAANQPTELEHGEFEEEGGRGQSPEPAAEGGLEKPSAEPNGPAGSEAPVKSGEEGGPQSAQHRIAGHDGRETTVLAGDEKLPAQYRLVEHGDIITSHNGTSFAKNEAYPKGVQERNYHSDKEAQNRVIGNAGKYDPLYTVNGNPDAVNGPPVVTPDGIAIGGNGRTMSLGRVYGGQGSGPEEYKQALRNDAAHYGLEPEAVDALKQPVLVREIEKPTTIQEMRRLGQLMNKSKTGAKNPAAAAVAAGRNIKTDTLQTIGEMLSKSGTGGEPASLRELLADGASGREVLKMLTQDGALTEEERAGYVQGKELSAEGKLFVERALRGWMFDDPDLIDAIPKGILQKVDGAIGSIAVIGPRDDSWNLLPVLRAGAAEHITIERTKMPVEDHLAQSGMFSARNELVDSMVRILSGKGGEIRNAFKSFAADSMHDVPNQGLLLVMAEPVAPHDSYNTAFGTTFTPDAFYDGLMAAAAEDPYEKQKEQEGAFRRQRTRGLSNRKPREEGGDRPTETSGGAPAEPGTATARRDALPAERGSRVTVTDRDGIERTGTVAHSNELKTRVKTETGELTVNTSEVKPVAQPAMEAQTGSNADALQSEPSTAEPAVDQAGGRREVADSGGESAPGVEGGSSGLREGAGEPGPANPDAAGEADRALVREDATRVSEPGAGAGPGEGSGAGIDSAPVGPVVKAAEKAAAKPVKRNTDWFSHPDSWSPPSGTMGKLDGNIAALRILRDIEKAPRMATPEEKAQLANFVGWGALQHAFEPYKAPYDQQARFRAANAELTKLLSPDELAAGKRSTQNAHYTSPELVRYMWDVLKQMGFTGGNVMEPSMGSGNFFGMMPKAIRSQVNAIGNELDPITAGIARLLYPGATVFNEDFTALVLPDNSLDLAISNVPFGVKVYDPKMPKLNAQIHDYFFVKSLDKVRPGGVVAFITSTGTMDKADSRIRDIMSSKADLIGAVRLPSGAFAKNAGTSVTTDLIVLRKRAPGEQPAGEQWAKAMEMSVPSRKPNMSGQIVDTMQKVSVNQYFHEHPEMMLGTPGVSTMYGRDGGFALLPRTDAKIEDLLKAAKAKFPKGILNDAAHPAGNGQAETVAQFAPKGYSEGQYVLDEKGNLRQVVDGVLKEPPAIENGDGTKNLGKLVRIKDMVGLRDGLNKLLGTMTEAADDEEGNSLVKQQRDELQKSYEKFVKKQGYLNAPANNVFEDDPHYPRLMALEDYDVARKVGTPADILSKRTIYPRAALTTLSSNPRDGLYQVLAERGYPDVQLMARLLNGNAGEIAKGLIDEGLIYRSPTSGDYEMREKYLSGYVRDKLADARAAVKQGLTEFEPNVKALEAVLPADIPIKDIEVKLGATWIPIPAIKQFVADVLNTESDITYSAGTWKASGMRGTAEVTSQFGTSRLTAQDILADSLNQREVRVMDIDEDKKAHLNQTETLLARQKQQAIRDAFNQWAGTSKEWAEPLATTYNQLYNNLVLPEYDGSHLTFPGMTASVTLKPHQKDAVWRVIQDGRGLLAHVVGAGKTFEMIASIMEGRRVGAFKKAMMAVPNHLVGQTRQSFIQLYPGAKLLVPTKKDFEAKNRRRFMAKIATGDYDAVIIAHSQFNQMDISPERQAKTLNGILDEYEETIAGMKAAGEKSQTVKQIEKARDQLRVKLDKLSDLKADKTINFDELGIDHLVVDEAHAYKNLVFVTKMQRIAGLAQGNSKRATRLKMKTEYLQDVNNGRGVVFATGTPLQNTMAEQYTMTRYVAPDVYERAGIHYFDDWAANFGSVRTKNELAADGRSFKARSRFSEFANVPELMSMFRSFTDIKTAKMLNLPTPKLAGGKPEANYIEPTPALLKFVESLMARAVAMQGKKVEKGGDNMLKIVSDGRKAALDMRLVNEHAEDNPDSKINQVVRDVIKNWKEGRADKTTQLIFLDQYRAMTDEFTPDPNDPRAEVAKSAPTERLNLYRDMKAKFIKAGIPESEIAIIGDYDTDAKKDKLFAEMNTGMKRILMGSTEKMGAGMNVQRLLKVLHHVDLPWRPGDLAQRNGRIERQGNQNAEVGIKYWLAQKSFDTYMLQALESKANFIEQLMSGSYVGRKIQDIDSTFSMNMQDMKVATSGNPDVKLKYDLEQESSQLMALERAHSQQMRDNAMRANSLRQSAARREGTVAAMKASLGRYEAVRGKDGEGFEMNVDGQKFVDRKSAFAHLEEMQVPWANFHMEFNGVGVAVTTYSEARADQTLEYQFSFGDSYVKAPERTMLSLGRSIESRLRGLSQQVDDQQESAAIEVEKADKLEKLAKSSFDGADRLKSLAEELKAVDARMDPNKGKRSDEPEELEDPDDEGDEPQDDDDEDGGSKPAVRKPSGGGVTMRASLFGVDIVGEAAFKALKTLYAEDVGPNLAKVASGSAAVGKSLVKVMAPRALANLDALDAMMRLKGDLEEKQTRLEYAMRGIRKMADSLTEEQRIEFIDRMKTGQLQGTPEMQEIAEMYRAADTAMHHEVVEAQIANMESATQRFWKNLDPVVKSDFWNHIEAGHAIAQADDAEKAKTGNADASRRLKLQEIADNTLTFKQNHMRVFWKVIPSPPDQLGMGQTKTPPPAGARRPLAGDKGFLKQATLRDISEGIARGGVPVTTNFQTLFELGQMSSLRYITAQRMWKKYLDLGLRKFVKPGDTAPLDWVKIDDRIAQVNFKAASGEGFVKMGDWYVEPSAARLINNYLSRDLMKDTAIGRGLMLFKGASTAIELGLSPYHASAMALESVASQMGLGVMTAWNGGLRGGNLQDILKGAGLIASAPAAPYTMARAGGRVIKAIENAKDFANSKDGRAFLKSFPDEAAAAMMISDYFTGGGTLHMPREYRSDTVQSMKEAWSKGNYLGAALRSPFAASTWAMKPLFETFIPHLKVGLFFQQYSQQLEQNHEAILSGDMTRAELARKVVDTVENRFGELNFSNLFWDNTYKSATQTLFRSITWKLGNWRGLTQALGPEMKAAFEDPIEAMRGDAEEGKTWGEKHIPKMGMNQAWLLGMVMMTAVMGTVLAKLLGGRYPWEYIGQNEHRGMSALGTLALETMHPRIGHEDPYTKLPVRLTVPTGIRDFEHAGRDPMGYVKSSLAGNVSKGIDSIQNRDFFGNYVYDPNAPLYKKMAELFAYNMPQPITVASLREGMKTHDYTDMKLGLAGMTRASHDYDLTKAERRMRDIKRGEHRPMTPDQVTAYQAKDAEPMSRKSARELRNAMKEGKMEYVQRLFHGMSYADARDVYLNLATPSEQRVLRPMYEQKRAAALKK